MSDKKAKAKKKGPSPRAVNQAATKSLNDSKKGRLAQLNALEKQIADKKADPAYKKEEAAVDEQLDKVNKAKETLTKEVELRKAIEKAYAASKSKQPEADPDVIAAREALAEHAKAFPALYTESVSVGDPCVSCISKDLKAIKRDPNYPLWQKTKYGAGPEYHGSPSLAMDNYSGWDDLIRKKLKTASEKDVLSAVASNEGKFDTVQSWDSESVTLGAMQKTADGKTGEGSLPNQLEEFKQSNPEKYQELFEDKGWSVRRDTTTTTKVNKKTGKKTEQTVTSRPRLYYTDPDDPDAKPVAGRDLKKLIRQKDDPEAMRKILQPLRDAGRDPDYQAKQVMDFNDEFLSVYKKNPKGRGHPMNKYITSEKGAALLMDQYVNRPAYVPVDLGKALDQFYKDHEKDKPPPDNDPDKWPPDKRAEYEQEILDNYAGDPDADPPKAGVRRTAATEKDRKLVAQRQKARAKAEAKDPDPDSEESQAKKKTAEEEDAKILARDARRDRINNNDDLDGTPGSMELP